MRLRIEDTNGLRLLIDIDYNDTWAVFQQNLQGDGWIDAMTAHPDLILTSEYSWYDVLRRPDPTKQVSTELR